MIGAYIGKKGGVYPYVRNLGVRDLNSTRRDAGTKGASKGMG